MDPFLSPSQNYSHTVASSKNPQLFLRSELILQSNPMSSIPYLKVPTGNDINADGDRHDSFELESLASSEEDGFSEHTPSSRGLSPLGSPIGQDSDRDSLMEESDYLNPTRHMRANSGSTLGDLMFTLPTTRERRSNIEVPLEKQKRLSLFNGLSLVIGLQIGLVAQYDKGLFLTF